MSKVLSFCNNKKIEDRLFDIGWIIFLFSRIFLLTAWCGTDLLNGGFLETVMQGLMMISLGLFAAVILLKLLNKEYHLMSIIFFAVLVACSIACFFLSGAKSFLAYAVLFAASYKMNGRRLITLSFIIMSAFMIIVLLSCAFGLCSNNEYFGRYGLGFDYCTTAPIMLLFIFLQYVYLRKEKMKLWEYAIFEAFCICFFVLCRTQFAFYLMTAAVVFFAIQGLLKKHWNILSKLKWLWLLFPLIICILAVLLHAFYKQGSELWDQLNDFLHERLRLGSQGLDEYGVKLFGNDITWIGNSNLHQGEYNFVDCAYLQILLRSGLIPLTLIMAIYTFLVYRSIKKNDYWLVFIILIICVFCVTEPCLLDMTTNALPVLAFAMLQAEPVGFKKGWLKNIFIEDIPNENQLLI